MLCRKPYSNGGVPVGCGQCLPCRINRRRLWTTRILLESYCHEASCFATLTYSDDELPSGGNLDPEHLKLFWKRLRKRLQPRRIRYFAVGEYGDDSWRPHYHAAVFGLSVLEAYHVEGAWGHGFIRLDELSPETAQYLCGYTVKKLTGKDDERLEGRVPEFARMSNRPGIGADAAAIIAEQLDRNRIEKSGDVPGTVRMRGQERALGRYLVSKLRIARRYTEDEIQAIKDQWSHARSLELHALLKDEIARGEIGSISQIAAKEDAGRAASLVARQKILNSKRRL